MALRALGYFLSGVVGYFMSIYLGGYLQPLFSLVKIPGSVNFFIPAIITGLFVLIAHVLLHKILKLD